MTVSVDGTTVVVELDGQETIRYEAAELPAGCVEAAIANAIASRFASVVTAAKGKSDEEVKKRLDRMIGMWKEGQWARAAGETAEEKLAKKLGLTVEELMEKLAK